MTAFGGPGKYDDLCTYVREKSQARAAAVLVFGGNKGGGFSIQGDLLTIFTLPEMLEDMARSIRKQQQESASRQ